MIDPYPEEQVTLARVGFAFAIVRQARAFNQFAFDHGYCRFCDADVPAHAPDCLGDLADAIADLDALGAGS